MTEIVFQNGLNGYGGTVDTFVSMNKPNTNYSASTELTVDSDTPGGSGKPAQALIRFDNLFGSDSSQIPAGATIVSAHLVLQTTDAGGGANLYRMLTAFTGASTWNSTVNGVQANGVEASASPEAVLTAAQLGIGEISIDVTASVAAWAAGASNLGWLFDPTSTNGWGFSSSEGTIKPKLVIEYDAGPVNTPPVASNDSAVTDEDNAVVVSVLGNDSDANGDSLTVTGATNPAHGSVVVNPNGTITYTPTANYNGSDSFTYTISDGHNGQATATVNLTVNAINDNPVAADDTASAQTDTPVTIAVLGNDSDIDGDSLTVTGTGTPAHGSVVVNANGTITYTPAAGYNGTDSFTYTVSDGHGGTSSATVNLSVAAPNHDPVAANDMATVDEDQSVIVSVLGNDSDSDGNSLTITGTGTPAHGSVVVNANGTITYTPNANYNGSDSFTYTVSDGHGGTATASVGVTVNTINDNPVAASDSASTAVNTSVQIAVLANDSDVDGDSLSVTGSAGASHGTVTLGPGNAITYTPDGGFAGGDSFTYTVSDGHGGSSTGTVNVAVQSASNAVEVSFQNGVNGYAGTVDTFLSQNKPNTNYGSSTALSVDSDTPAGSGKPAQALLRFDNLFGTGSGQIPQGSAIVSAHLILQTTDAGGGANLYRMLSAFTSSSTWNTMVNGVQIDGVEASTSPEAVLAAAQLGVGQISIDVTASLQAWSSGATNLGWLFNPTSTNGWDFSSAEGAIKPKLVVQYSNIPPAAQNDSAVVDEDHSVTVSVLGNDSDANGDAVTLTGVGTASHGTVTVNADHTVTYTPNANYNGADSFTYSVSDGHGGNATATVHVTVNPVNDLPVAGNDTVETNEDTPITISVLANDTDPDGDTLVITGTSTPAHGSIVVNANGTITYTPVANYDGSDSFTYTISDGHGGTSTATVFVTDDVVNDPPTAVNDTVSTNEDTAVAINVLGNDSDIENDTLIVIGVTSATHGTVTLNPDNTVTYTPNANFNGDDSFTYTVSDGHGGNATATATIHVAPVNDNPVANTDTASTANNMAVVVDALANDTDVDGDTLTFVNIPSAAHGQVTLNADHTLTYLPDSGFAGVETISYAINDGHGGTAAGVINVTVQASVNNNSSYIATTFGQSSTDNFSHDNASKSFYYNGHWYAVLPDGNSWSVHRFDGSTPGTGQQGGWTKDSGNLSTLTKHTDIAFDDVNHKLYVLQYSGLSTKPLLYKMGYNATTSQWVTEKTITLAGTGTSPLGTQYSDNEELALSLDSNGNPLVTAIGPSDVNGSGKGLFISYALDSTLTSWGTTLLDADTTSQGGTNGNSKADIVTFTLNGQKMVGVVYSQDNGATTAWKMSYHVAGSPTSYSTGWSSDTLNNSVSIDNHISVVSDGTNLYVAMKDADNSIWIQKGTPGAWQQPVKVYDGQHLDTSPSRPTLVYDSSHNDLYIFYQEHTQNNTGSIFMKEVNANNLVFNTHDLGTKILTTGNASLDLVDPQGPANTVGDQTGGEFFLFARGQDANDIWYNDILLA